MPHVEIVSRLTNEGSIWKKEHVETEMLTASQRELFAVPRSEHSARRHGEHVKTAGREFRADIEWTLCAAGLRK